MAEILCSTGALIGKPNSRDYMLLDSLKKELNCDGFEFMLYSAWYECLDEIADFLQEKKIYTPVMHAVKSLAQKTALGDSENIKEAIQMFETNCQFAARIKAKKLVLHLWNGRISDSNFSNNMETFAEFSSIAQTYGIDLLVENVVCNVNNPMMHWCELKEKYPDIHFVFDTKMAAFHEQLELIYKKEYEWLWKEEHIRHYHVNDYGGGYMEWGKLCTLPIGKGHIDFERFFEFVKKTGYSDTFTVEATAFDETGAVDTSMLNECFGAIREFING